MKNCIAILFIVTLFFTSCEDPIVIPQSDYDCSMSFVDNSSNHPKATDFQAKLDEIAAVTPGIQVAVTTSDGQKWTGADGWADIPNEVALQPCNKLMIGSISKVFTGVLITQLHDEGILSINDKMSDWLDNDLIGEIANSSEVTIEHLLNHTSGIPDYLAAEHFIDALNNPNFTLTQSEKLTYIYGKNANNAVGEVYEYSNSNYVLLGLIIEKARNMTLWDAVDTYIVKPLNLENTLMGTHDEPIPTGTARPYLATRGDKYYDIMENAVSDAATGDGGIASNMQDLNVFIEALFNGNLVSNDALSLMTDRNVLVQDGNSYEWEDERYGLGLEIYNTDYGIAYGHTGSTSTYSAYLLHFPERGVTISFAYNGAAYHNSEVESLKWNLRHRLLEIIFE